MPGSLIVLTGPPGAGKSTVARAVAAGLDRAVHLHTDDFWRAIVTGAIPPYEEAADQQNHTVMQVIAAAGYTYALGGHTTVVDGVIGPSMLRHFRPWRDAHPSIPVHYVLLRPDRDTTQRRARSRAAPDALTDPAALGRMWDYFADLGPLEPHAIDTTSWGVEQTVLSVRRAVEAGSHLLAPSGRAGTFVPMTAPTPYLHFAGRAGEALAFYRDVFGGRVVLYTFEEFGRTDGPGDAVAHGHLTDGPVALFAADAADAVGDAAPIRCDGMMLSLLGAADPPTLRGWFAALLDGGRVVEDLQRRPWGASDGQVVDRYGVHWLIGFEGDEA